MLAAYQLGRRDVREGRDYLPPVYLDEHESVAYAAGYRRELKTPGSKAP
jgi:hypothetical protein